MDYGGKFPCGIVSSERLSTSRESQHSCRSALVQSFTHSLTLSHLQQLARRSRSRCGCRITTTAATRGGCGRRKLGRVRRGEWKVSGEED